VEPTELPGAGGAGGAGAGDDELQAATSLEVAFWLERTGPGVEQQATAPSAPEPEAPAVEGKEPAPITQPIEPQRRCGCSASEGATGLGLLVGALALRRRRQHDASAPAEGERQP
jgi:MYXO-CTERM domain-containing protein